MTKEAASIVLSVDGREVHITHPEKLYFSQAKVSKLDLVRYYLSVSPGALAGIRHRPIVLKRFVNGAEGEAFYQKRAPSDRPSWLRTVTLAFPSGRTAEELVVDDDAGLKGWAKTSGSRGMHVIVRIQPRWSFTEVRRAALALSRAVERRLPALASSKWWKEERHGVFLDYNQNAKDRTTCSAYSVRPVPDARVSTPLHWHEVADCDPADFTVLTVPKRFAELGDPHEDMDADPGSLEALLELADRDKAEGLGDAPWPPHFRKMEREAARVAPSRAKSSPKKTRNKMPLLVIANSTNKDAALTGLERWKRKHRKVAKLLTVEDVLVDTMRGRSSTWTRIRVNLRNVPEELRPSQETPDPDDDPTREWREWRDSKRGLK